MRESLTTMAAKKFRFGLFEFEVETGELRREGSPVRLQSQPAQVLAYSCSVRGRRFSREDFRQAVWRDDTFVDFERGLNFCVAQIRAALNDNASEPRFIRTIPKRGYQFIAPVLALAILLKNPHSSHCKQFIQDGRTHRGSLHSVGCHRCRRILAALRAQPTPIVAVLRFDNETGNPEMTRFSDGLTDSLVAELTTRADGHYRVIGNANILRLPRDQRDLRAVASSLSASYVVFGQVQSDGDQTRVLAHLIHLPEQTHVWVARIEHNLDDPLSLESQIAKTVAAQFLLASNRVPPPFPHIRAQVSEHTRLLFSHFSGARHRTCLHFRSSCRNLQAIRRRV